LSTSGNKETRNKKKESGKVSNDISNNSSPNITIIKNYGGKNSDFSNIEDSENNHEFSKEQKVTKSLIIKSE